MIWHYVLFPIWGKKKRSEGGTVPVSCLRDCHLGLELQSSLSLRNDFQK